MATRTIVKLVDDTDRSEATETIQFGLDGEQYEIDLSEANATALRKGLREFIEKARRIPAVKSQTPRTRARRIKTADVRAWAKLRGITIQDRGRIPAEIIAQYEASQRAVTPTERANLTLATEPTTAPETAPQSPPEPLDDPEPTEPPEPGNGNRNSVIRAWAKLQGIKINDRGKIPANIVAEYEASQSTEA